MSKRNLIMFIAITGSPTKEKLIKMMKGYKDTGINDVIIYPEPAWKLSICLRAGVKYFP